METNFTLLEKVKMSLRIDEDDHDDELSDLIGSAKREIVEAGASPSKISDDDDLIRRACILYCKAQFGSDDNKDRYAMAFEKMLIKISLLSSYKDDANEV